MSSIDTTRALQLITGVAGIYISYLVTGVVHESMYLLNHKGLKANIKMIGRNHKISSLGPLPFSSFLAESHGSSVQQSTIIKLVPKNECISLRKMLLFAELQYQYQH